MFTRSRTVQAPSAASEAADAARRSELADRACRRAWWSLALYPVSFVAAFVVGAGLLTLLTDDTGSPAPWEALLAGTPALLVFALPGVGAIVLGRRAVRLGREDGLTPALVGAAIAVSFFVLNLASYVAGLVAG